MLLSVQVDATGPLLDGHDREAYVDAAMKFAFLDLKQVRDTFFLSLIKAQFTQGYSESNQFVKFVHTSFLSSITFTTSFFHIINSEETKASSILLITSTHINNVSVFRSAKKANSPSRNN